MSTFNRREHSTNSEISSFKATNKSTLVKAKAISKRSMLCVKQIFLKCLILYAFISAGIPKQELEE